MATGVRSSGQGFLWYWARHWRDLGFIFTFFLAVVAITNFVYNNFGLRLTEFFTVTFDALNLFLHSVLNFLVFSWLSYLLQWLCLSLTWLASCVLPFIDPWFPEIVIPAWVSDLMLLSLALSRAFDSAYLLIPREDRERAEADTTPRMKREIEEAQGILNWPHKITHWITTFIWKLVSKKDGVLTLSLEKVGLPASVGEAILKPLAAAVFLWGFVRLFGYSINVGMAGHLDHIPLMTTRKRLWKVFLFSLFAAVVVAAAFLYINELIVEFKEPQRIIP